MIVVAAPAGEAAKAGPWWGAVVLLLCVACWLLFRSMSKHLRKVRDEFPSEQQRARSGPSLTKQPPGQQPSQQQPSAGQDASPPSQERTQ